MSQPNTRRYGAPPFALAMLYVVIAVLPLLLALMAGGRFGSSQMRLAAACGMVSGVMILLQMVSSGRFEAVSGRIGIDVTMAFHKWAAPVALLFALSHVAALAWPRGGGVQSFAQRLSAVASQDSLVDARLALALLMLLVALALLRNRLPFRYEVWRASHGLAALALLSLMLWHIIGDGFGGTLSIILWLTLTLAVTMPAVWVYARRLAEAAGSDWCVAETKKIADRLWEVTLDSPTGRMLDFRAGQFAWASFGGRRLPLYDHPFSITSSPAEKRLRFIIQEAGDFSGRIGTTVPGTRVGLDAPHGSFGVKLDGSTAILLIAGGVGIAPILSILAELAQAGCTRPVRFIYAARRPDAMVPSAFYAASCASLGTTPMLLADRDADAANLVQGPLTVAHLQEAMTGLDPGQVEALICGPGPMMTMATDALCRHGVPLSRISYERFDYATRHLSMKDRRMLSGFAALWAAIAALAAAYSFA